jgi:replicative DNA helicase
MSGNETRQTGAPLELTPYRLKDYFKEVKGNPPMFKTGYPELDDLIQIPCGAITIIAARPAHGKTAFQLNLLANFLKDSKRQKFYFFSYEEARKYIVTKLIMIMAGKTLRTKKNFNFNDYLDYMKYRSTRKHVKDPIIEDAIDKYDKLTSNNRLFIFDRHFKDTELAPLLRNLGKQKNVGAVFIDYIQKIPVGQTNPGWNRYQEIKLVLEKLLDVLKDTNFPIIMGAQLKRSTSKKDSLSSLRLDYLREAGDIEQDANIVLGISNPAGDDGQKKSEQEENLNKIKVFVLKNRSGVSGKEVSLAFDRPTLRIYDNTYGGEG